MSHLKLFAAMLKRHGFKLLEKQDVARGAFLRGQRYVSSGTSEPFPSGSNSNYVEEMYYAWLENPKSVHKVSLKLDCNAGLGVEWVSFTFSLAFLIKSSGKGLV